METPGVDSHSIFGYALIGFLVGVVPVALGLMWLPALRGADPRWLAAFMALTAGLLVFALDALSEALALQAALPGQPGTGLVLLGVAASYLALTFVSERLGRRGRKSGVGSRRRRAGDARRHRHGLHNLGEGLAIGPRSRWRARARELLIVGFMVHNVTEGLGIAVPIAEGTRVSLGRLAALAVVAGAPAIVGAWIGGFLTSDLLGVLFAVATGAALQVVVEVGRYVCARRPAAFARAGSAAAFSPESPSCT